MAQLDGAWSETALVGISAASGTDVKFASITETIDIDIGDKDFDVIATLSGGRLVKFTPQEPTTITLEAYPIQAASEGFTTATTGAGFFDLMNTYDASQPLSISVDRTRNKHRVAIMWIDSSSETDATTEVVTPTNSALRVVAADGYFTSVKPSFTDGVLKFTVTYKVPPFDSSGSANVKIESVSGAATATLTALASYTSTTKW